MCPHHQWRSVVSSGELAGPGLRHRVQTDSAQVPSGRWLDAHRRLASRRGRSAGAPHLHTNTRNMELMCDGLSCDLLTEGQAAESQTNLSRCHPLVGHRHQTGLPQQHLLLLLLISKRRFGRRLQLVGWRREGRRRGRNGGQHR